MQRLTPYFLTATLFLAACAAPGAHKTDTQEQQPKAPEEPETAESEAPDDREVAQQQDAPVSGEPVPCDSYEDARKLSGQRVVVEGTYEQVDVRMRRPEVNPEPVYKGHAVIRLENGNAIFLEPIWSDDAIRPSDELERYEGSTAQAVGVIHYRCPSSPDTTATITNPCLRPVESVTAP